MNIVFETHGSTYYINTNTMTWKRDKTALSGDLFGVEGGPLAHIPDIVVGYRCLIAETEYGLLGTISTSPVERILSVSTE